MASRPFAGRRFLMAQGDYEFDLDRRVARQLGDPDRGTGMPSAFSEKLRKRN